MEFIFQEETNEEIANIPTSNILKRSLNCPQTCREYFEIVYYCQVTGKRFTLEKKIEQDVFW